MTKSICDYCETQDECEEECYCGECLENHDQPCDCEGCTESRANYMEAMQEAYD